MSRGDETSPAGIDDRFAREIASGDVASISQEFQAAGLSVPRLVWNPAPSDLPRDNLRRLLQDWHRHRGARPLADFSLVDPVALQYALGYLMVLDVLDGGRDFRYRVYGSLIAERYGSDMTGRLVSDFGGVISTFFLGTYRAMLHRREPLFTVHTPPLRISVAQWDRLALPLADDTGEVGRLLVANVPGEWRAPASAPSQA